ncbi:hypothetical protein N7509_003976 [Penicillium cosmopolitanum]|uniref:Septin-type G domain-containing protein n=1 Tax=Penicillium cosmopolitanum TaxID=1131564 RepID=A0A9W9W627_9EURO|nr:uncharacterized protein N7509_003976 [Penicillium cosmopolitanum]KAJ5404105.1 hypothetical protein N7509_003976 [Penicillium cosmopolitanum]
MRPAPDLPLYPQKASLDHPSPSLDPRTTATPATFFLSRNLDASDSESSLPRTNKMMSKIESRRRSTIKPSQPDVRGSSIPPVPVGHDTVSRPLTPLNPDDAPSLPSSPKSISNHSLRPLDDISIADEINSQAIASGDEDERPGPSPRLGASGAPQLIMPSIKMPSRRPFTERGKAMGRFKILIAGASGSGKTSLIKSIVQTCEDIVHVDSLGSPSPITSLERRRSSRAHSSGSVPTRGALSAINEIYASTKPYPAWWSDLEDSRVLRRRKSIGEIVLERNLCFVDTSAISLSRPGQTDAILQYMRQQFHRATAALNSSSVDMQNLLAGNGGSQVDAIIYLVSNATLSTDIECIRKLCELTNVIPVVAKADKYPPEQIEMTKVRFHQEAQSAGIKPFLFGAPPEGLEGLDPQPPYTVSSEKTTDLEVMDASTLMSPDYVQPLVASELDILVHKLFDREHLAWMRHSAAKKLVQRGGEFSAAPPPPTAPLSPAFSADRSNWQALSADSLNSSFCSIRGPSPPSYAMARLSDYTRHEERMAQVHLAHWATDLQRSLQNERDRYASLARGDRAVWLTEKLSECVIDGSLVPISKTPGFCGLYTPSNDKHPGLHSMRSTADYQISLSHHDPLGIVGWIDDLGRRSWALVQIVGSVGVVGGLALWLARTWGLPTRSLSDLHLDYWYGTLER